GETAAIYGSMPWPEVVARVRHETGLPAGAYVAPSLPTLARRQPVYHGKPRNLVILLEESLGAQFIGHLGGRRLSPQLDELSKQAWTFTSMYATGTRSVRGIEAVITGFTPTPAQAVVKLPDSQTGFFSLAEVLARHGYDTTFYYGGESHFDNMRSFFLGNGFKHVIDQKDFVEPAFTGSWGVSDEDLVRRADAEFNKLHAAGKPFFGLVFSSSNHDPFEFPDGRITLAEQPKQTRDNAAKYADYAIGEFFRLAKNAPYWKDTVFLVVADHDSRVLGHDLVPIDNFHIPALLLGAGIAPHMDERIASQIDLPPTLLSLLGFDDATPMTGHDLNDDLAQRPGRAMMQYEHNFAWMDGNAVTILSPQHRPQGYVWDASRKQLQPGLLDAEVSRTALAVALWGSESYRKRLYRSSVQPP
ncbi:MAG: LTA synthase family protein, partial [Pseudomonadota bacterium]|nr:LTA synthase family protein [Pseudomonadota bacterium]